MVTGHRAESVKVEEQEEEERTYSTCLAALLAYQNIQLCKKKTSILTYLFSIGFHTTLFVNIVHIS
jgi:hypothetical protein